MGEQAASVTETVKRAGVALKQAELPFALCGGFAVFARGGPPSEHDADFLVLEQDVPRALEALTAAGFRAETPAEDWLVKAYDDDGTLVDLIFRVAGRPVTEDVLDRAEILDVESVRMPVSDATDLMAGKLLAMNEHFCDFAAVLGPARALREQVDWDRLREETAGSPFARAFLVLAEDLDVAPPPAYGLAGHDGRRAEPQARHRRTDQEVAR